MSGVDAMEAARSRLKAGVEALGLTIDDEAQGRLLAYGDLLLRWTRRVNLISARATPTEVVERHLLDALALLRLELGGAHRVLDVGAGGGLPGVPLQVAAPFPDLTLLEPIGKRVAFLRAAVREIPLDGVTVRQGRLEQTDGVYDLLLSRATFAPDEWVRRAAPLCAPGGAVVAMLSRQNVDDVVAAAEEGGLTLAREDRFELPGDGSLRVNLLLERPPVV